MRKKRSRRNEDLYTRRKRQIAEAALKVFSEKGYEGSTTKEIAKKARVSEGTIFKYFDTKKDMLLYTLNILSEEMLEELTEELVDGNGDKDILKNTLKKHYRLIVNNYDLLKTIFYEIQFHKELREAFYKEILSNILDKIEKFIDELELDGNAQPRIAAEVLLGMLMGIIVTKSAIKTGKVDVEDEEKVVSDVINILFYGIKGRD